MSEAPLTQEEIQALIAGMSAGDENPAPAAAPAADATAGLEEELVAAYAELAASLTEALGAAAMVGQPAVETVAAADLALSEGAKVVHGAFGDGLTGTVALVLDEEAAARLGDALTPEALGDQVFTALAARFASVLGQEVTVTPAESAEGAIAESGFGENITQAFTPLEVDGEPAGHWLLLLDGAVGPGLADGKSAAVAAAAALPAPVPAPAAVPAAAAAPVPQQPAPVPRAPAERPLRAVPPVQPSASVPVQPAAFGDVGRASDSGDLHNIDLLLDVPLQVTVELGRTRRQIKDVLSLGPGSVLELDRLAGEPVDVLVNGQLVAHGEVVVIDENFGVRITDIISPADRVRSL